MGSRCNLSRARASLLNSLRVRRHLLPSRFTVLPSSPPIFNYSLGTSESWSFHRVHECIVRRGFLMSLESRWTSIIQRNHLDPIGIFSPARERLLHLVKAENSRTTKR